MELRAEIPPQAREWRNYPSIWKWCRQYSPISEAQHEEWLSRIERDASIKMFGILDTHTLPGSTVFERTGFVGVCGLTSIDKHNQTAEFSLYIAPEFQRRGLGAKALTLLLDHGFQNMNFNRIWGETFEGNPALGMFKKLGMKEEGRLRQTYFRDGRFIDSILVSMLRQEWNA